MFRSSLSRVELAYPAKAVLDPDPRIYQVQSDSYSTISKADEKILHIIKFAMLLL
jgi:hypothetical protein